MFLEFAERIEEIQLIPYNPGVPDVYVQAVAVGGAVVAVDVDIIVCASASSVGGTHLLVVGGRCGRCYLRRGIWPVHLNVFVPA